MGAVEGTEDTGVQKRACVPLLEGRKKVTDPWVGGRRGGWSSKFSQSEEGFIPINLQHIILESLRVPLTPETFPQGGDSLVRGQPISVYTWEQRGFLTCQIATSEFYKKSQWFLVPHFSRQKHFDVHRCPESLQESKRLKDHSLSKREEAANN